jgi:glutathione S-transferase
MIKVYGTPVSNYSNMVTTTLLEKGIEFVEITTMPNSDLLIGKSPMGKVPCVEINGHFLSETATILDYIEKSYPNPPLYPADAIAKAKVRELARIIELYFELVLRRLYPTVFFGAPRDDTIVSAVKPQIEKGILALNELAKFGPYLAGSEFGIADIYAYNSFGYGNKVTQSIYDLDLTAAIPGLSEAFAAISARDSVKKVDSAQQQALAELMAQRQEAG